MSARAEQRVASDAWINRAIAKPVGVRGTFHGLAVPTTATRRVPTERETKAEIRGRKAGFLRGYLVGCGFGFALGFCSALLLVALR